MPVLESEYYQYKCKKDGSQRTIAEMIDYARENDGKVFLPFMQTVIRETEVARNDNSLGILDSLNKFIHIASENSEVDFINSMIKNCLPISIDNYIKTFEDKERKRTDDDLIAYQSIVTYLSTSKENKQPSQDEQKQNKQNVQEGIEYPQKTISERLEKIKSIMEKRWPGITVDAEKLYNKRNKRGFFGNTSVYDQLKKNKVNVEGKRNAAEIEKRMLEKKHQIEYDG